MKSKTLVLAVIGCCVSVVIRRCWAETELYVSAEQPKVTFFDKSYYSSVIFKSKQMSRRDPTYYVTVIYTSLRVMDNSFMMNLYFYELLSNVYKRTFVEIHWKVCDFVEKDEIVGAALRRAYYRKPEKDRPTSVYKCPLPPGRYEYPNMTFALTGLVNSFPFHEGRVYINVTHLGKTTGLGYIDFHFKSRQKSVR